MSRYLIAGMSHIESLRRGWSLSRAEFSACEMEFLNFKCYRQSATDNIETAPTVATVARGYIEPTVIAADFVRKAAAIDAAVLCINGNEHNLIGLVEIDTLDAAMRVVGGRVTRVLEHWVGLLRPLIHGEAMLLLPPPPIEDEVFIRLHAGVFAEKIAQYPIRAAADRLKLWQHQCAITEKFCARNDIRVLRPPASCFSVGGFLAPDCRGNEPTHGSNRYGRLVVRQLIADLQGSIPPIRVHASGTVHPYVGLPDHAYWKQSISEIEAGSVDPVVSPRFLIHPTDKVATAGSCFAQHISKRLRAGGFRFLLAEMAGDEASAQARGFYDFSARYGNIYTARQLLQLFDRAFDDFQPFERAWPRPQGGFCDPFRPRIEPDGFPSIEAVLEDMRLHLTAVRQMFEQLDVFVFTLGLTECWIAKLDGAAYPIAPGVAGGAHDPAKHAFVNFSVAEVVSDLDAFLSRLKHVNPRARVLLTVSPVPLVATCEERHVLVSSTYSKSVLRVAAAEVVARHPHVEYFPSYEIITGPHAGGRYFGPDRRSVTDAGVDHVMRIFMDRMTEGAELLPVRQGAADDRMQAYAEMQAAADAACDEELYARDGRTPADRM